MLNDPIKEPVEHPPAVKCADGVWRQWGWQRPPEEEEIQWEN